MNAAHKFNWFLDASASTPTWQRPITGHRVVYSDVTGRYHTDIACPGFEHETLSYAVVAVEGYLAGYYAANGDTL